MPGKRANREGSIRQRPDGRWEARYTIGRDPGTGKQVQRSIYGETQKEVAKELRKATSAIDEGTYMELSKMTVGQWLDAWLKDYTANLKPGTLCLYRRHVKNYVRPYIGNVKLSVLSPHHLQNLYNRLLNGEDAPKLTTKTIKNLHGIVHKLLEQAVELNYLRVNPSDACKLPRVERPEMHPLDDVQIGLFLKAIQGHRFENLYLVDLFTGLRQSEIMGLTWDCVDFEKGTIYVYRQLQLIDGKYQFGALKNDKTRKIMPAPFVMNALQNQKRLQAQWKLKAWSAWQQDNFIFSDELGGHLARQTVYKQFKQIMNGIGLPDTRFHDLRHSYAVSSLRAGDDVKTVQENLGHHTAAFTLDQYGHVTETMKQASAARMEAFIQGIKKG